MQRSTPYNKAMGRRVTRFGGVVWALVCASALAPAVGCGAFGSTDPPDAAAADGAPSSTAVLDSQPPPRDAVSPDGAPVDAAAGCPVTGKAAFDPTFGVGGVLQLPGEGQPVAALGPGGALYVSRREDCGDAGLEIALRRVPLSGANAGTIAQCFTRDVEYPLDLSGDPASGYLLATRVTSGIGQASLRRLLPDGGDRAATVNAGNFTEPTFAQRVPGATPLDVWGYYATAGAEPGKGSLQTIPGGTTQVVGAPVAGASYAGALFVAFLRDATSPTATVVVKRYVTGASAQEDPSFGTQELPVPNTGPLSFAPNALIASDGIAVLAMSQGGSSNIVVFGPGGARPLPPLEGFGVPRIARRCDGKLVTAHTSSSNLVIGRYDGDKVDTTFRATRPALGTVAFLLPLPDGALVVGMSSGQLFRVSP